MSINLGEVFTTFATKYDKQNILNYAGILFFLSLLGVVVGIDSTPGIVLCAILYILITTIYIGYYVVTSNNEANNIKNAFPSISDINIAIREGIKYSFGMFSLSFIVYSVPFLILFLFALFPLKEGFNLLSGLTFTLGCIIFLVLIVILGYFIVLPLQIIYLKTLNFSDFFAFSKIKPFKKRKGSQFLTFFLYTILINMAICVVASTLSVITVIAGGIAKIGNIEIYSQLFNLFVTMVLYNLLLPNLNGQIARYDVANEPNYDDYELVEDDEYEDEEDV